VATNTTKRNKLTAALKKWEYWVGILSIVFTIALAALIVLKWEAVQALEGYGYVGGFAISALGGATVIIPVPMLAVQFALGGVLKPWFGPEVMGPVFVGIVCGLGETVGGLTIYFTGYGGGTPLAHAEAGRIQRAYLRLVRLMERRGSITLFLLSAIINPFFYPAALAAGAVRFGIRRYFLISFAGKAIKCTAIAYAGYFGLRGIFSALGIPL
jgi:membrane protein DedA with SNARE-associated domain